MQIASSLSFNIIYYPFLHNKTNNFSVSVIIHASLQYFYSLWEGTPKSVSPLYFSIFMLSCFCFVSVSLLYVKFHSSGKENFLMPITTILCPELSWNCRECWNMILSTQEIRMLKNIIKNPFLNLILFLKFQLRNERNFWFWSKFECSKPLQLISSLWHSSRAQ